MTKLVIFDLDGTLLDTIGDLAASCDAVLAMHSLPRHTYNEYRMMVGRGILRLVEAAIPEHLRTAEFVETVRADFVKYYLEHIDEHTLPYDGITDLLQQLAASGIAVAVASNKFQAGTEKLVRRFFPDIPFAAVLGQRPPVPLKPDPHIDLEIMAAAGVRPAECLHVGDSGIDMLTARAAGIRSVGVTWGFRTREELVENGADAIIDRPSELSAIL